MLIKVLLNIVFLGRMINISNHTMFNSNAYFWWFFTSLYWHKMKITQIIVLINVHVHLLSSVYPRSFHPRRPRLFLLNRIRTVYTHTDTWKMICMVIMGDSALLFISYNQCLPACLLCLWCNHIKKRTINYVTTKYIHMVIGTYEWPYEV